MPGMRYQPQRRVRLSRSSGLLRGASAVLTGSASTNLVTGVPLIVAGTGVAKRVTPAGIADSFRKNFYKETELLPAIGVQPFVEFWVGYPSADFGSRGNSGEAGFLIGSSNNRTGIAARIGAVSASGGNFYDWGAIYSWATMATAGEVLVPDQLTCLIAIRRVDRIELWRDGIKVGQYDGPAIDHPANRMIVGGFVEDTGYWVASSDMLLAGRVIAEWSPDEARFFSQNPWQLFDDDDEGGEWPVESATSYSLTIGCAALGMAGGQVATRVSRRLRAAPAALTVAAGQVAMRAARRLRTQPAGLALATGPVSVRASRRLSVQPAALDVLAGQVRMAVSRRFGVQPAALVVAGQGVTLRAGRRMQVTPMSLAIGGGPVAMQYSPALVPGEYTLPVSAAAMTLGGGSVGMRVSRRLSVASAGLALAVGAARLLAGRRAVVSPAALAQSVGQVGIRAARRMRVQPAHLAVAGGNMQLRYSSQIEYARAPAGAGYAPKRAAISTRPAQTGGHRPPAIQETTR